MRKRPKTKSGRRSDLKNIYFRSSWEANVARYLNLLIIQNKIDKWLYEPDTFFFPIEKGTRHYTPDFKVFKGNYFFYYEVKGYMDAVSKTKLKRMKKFFPQIKIVLIDRPIYQKISKLGVLNWE